LLDMITHLVQLAPLLVLLKTHGTPEKMLTCVSHTCLAEKKCHLGNAKFFALAETCDQSQRQTKYTNNEGSRYV
jgi:hypothetical protein